MSPPKTEHFQISVVVGPLLKYGTYTLQLLLGALCKQSSLLIYCSCYSGHPWKQSTYTLQLLLELPLKAEHFEAEHPVCPACRSNFRPRKWLKPIARYLTDLTKEALPSSFLIEAFWVSAFTSGTFIWCSSLWLSRIPCSGACVTTTTYILQLLLGVLLKAEY